MRDGHQRFTVALPSELVAAVDQLVGCEFEARRTDGEIICIDLRDRSRAVEYLIGRDLAGVQGDVLTWGAQEEGELAAYRAAREIFEEDDTLELLTTEHAAVDGEALTLLIGSWQGEKGEDGLPRDVVDREIARLVRSVPRLKRAHRALAEAIRSRGGPAP